MAIHWKVFNECTIDGYSRQEYNLLWRFSSVLWLEKNSQCCFPNCKHIDRRPTAIQRKVIIDYYSEAFSVPLSVFCEPFHLPNVYKKVTVQRENIQRVGDRLMHMAIHWKEFIEYHTGLCPTSLSDYLSYFVCLPKFSNLIGI